MSALLGCRFPVRIGFVLFPRSSSNNAAVFSTGGRADSASTVVSTNLHCTGRLASVAVSESTAHADQTVRVGQVISAEANFLRVKLASPSIQDKQHLSPQLLCQVRGVLKKKQQRVLVGDHVQVGAINWKENRGMVEAILPRSSQLTDPAVANITNAVLLFSLTNPPFEEEQVSRFLVSVEATQLPLTLILNKGDLVDDATRELTVAVCRSWGYEPFVVSCSTGAGVREVAEELRGKVSVVAGPSGVGKSSLINFLRLGKHRRETPQDRRETPQDSHAEQDAGHGNICLLEPALGTSHSAASGTQGAADGMNTTYSLLDEACSGERVGSQEEGGCGNEGKSTTVPTELMESAAQARNGHHLPAHTPDDASTPEESRSDPPLEALGPAVNFLSVGELSKIKRGTHTTRTVSLLQLPGGGLLADSPGFNQPSLDKVASQNLMHCFPEMRALMEEEGCRFRDCLHIQEPGCCINEAGLQRWPFYLKLLAEVQAREQHEEEVLQLSKREREGHTKIKMGRGGAVRHELRLSVKKHRRVSRNTATQQWQQALDE